MKYNYLQQAIASIRQQPLVSTVSIVGTALSILLIMVVVMMEDIKIVPYSPESNRDRWLVQMYGSIANDNWDGTSAGPLGYEVVRDVFYKMEVPETVTAFSSNVSATISTPGATQGQASFGARQRDVDDRFWDVMDFSFISGKPFTRADFEAGIPKAVISESVARKAFQSTDVEGREILINYIPYKVAGVVKDVSDLATVAYSEVWVPYSSTKVIKEKWNSYMGLLSVIILAKEKGDFPAIREEYKQKMAEFGDKMKLGGGWKFIDMERPYTQEVAVYTPWANMGPDMKAVRKKRLIVFSILLIVPAINLSSMTHSRLRRRREEIGIRRAFGAPRATIVKDIFIENLLITIVSGLIGLIMSVIFAMLWSGNIFGSTNVSLGMMLNWSTFGWTLLFCFILNLLSSGLPSWQASRVNVVNALSNKIK